MASKALPASSFPATPLLNEFTARVREQDTPAHVLDALHGLASKHLPLSVLGAARFPDQGIGLALHAAWTETCSCIPRCRKAGGRSTPPWPCTSTTRA